MTAEELTALGYRRVSNKFGMIARIDRSDWLAFMLERQPNWKNSPTSMIADHYRRVISKDVLVVDQDIARRVPTSCHDPVGYIWIGDPPQT